MSIRAACLLSDPVSLPLSESSGAFLKKRFFTAEHAFMLLRFFIPRGMSCLCRHYEQTSLSTLCFLQMERKSCLAGFFPHISTSKEGGIYFHEKVVLLLKTAYSGLSVCHPFDGYRGQPGSAHPAGDPTYFSTPRSLPSTKSPLPSPQTCAAIYSRTFSRCPPTFLTRRAPES